MANNACNEYGPGPNTGTDCVLYLAPGIVYDEAPTYSIIVGEITDFSVDDFSLNLAELKRRGNKYTKSVAALFNALTISFRMVHGLDQASYTEIQTAFMDRTARQIRVADSDVALSGDHEVLELPVLFTAFPWDQPLEDITGHDITASLAYACESGVTPNELDPTWSTITV